MSRIVWSLLLLYCLADEVICIKFTTLQLVSRVLLELSDTNIVICPPAIYEALAQVYLGASGESEAELKEILGYPWYSKSEVLEAFVESRNPQLKISSRMFLSNGFPILPSFQKQSKKYFSTDAESTDLSAQGANKVNQWISKTTKGRIDDLIDPSMLDDGAKVILVNAVSFEAFLMLNSVEGSFYLPDEKRSVKVKMMDIVGDFQYRFQSALDSHIVTLPYKSSTLSLAIIVPRTFRGITNLEDNLEHLDLDEMSLRRVHITLPKFKIKYEQDMAQPLIDLGLKSIFNHANLSDLTRAKETLRVDSMAHLVSIEVNEIGAKSSAATGSVWISLYIPFLIKLN
ncbi:hypothetical protein KR084_003798 [Drosophila pseudotakahashii]|nr:hypothetical protein KR084_003798 [Drosophila pseudotakahashii]